MKFDYQSIYNSIQTYFQSLNQNEQYAWMLILGGSIFVIVALFILLML